MARKYIQGSFKPTNPRKYKGDVDKIFYRSGWEKKVFIWLDLHPSCIEWNSEEVVIPYRSPVDSKIHRYFVDVKASFVYPNNSVKVFLIEIKPYAQTLQPEMKKGKSKKRFLEEMMTYQVNQAKWEQARNYCLTKNWQFKIITEYDMGLKKNKNER